MKFSSLSLTAKLTAINLLLVGSLVGVIGFVWKLLPGEREAAAEVALFSRAQRSTQNADMLHDALRSDVMSALLAGQVPGLTADGVLETLRTDARAFHNEIASVDQMELPAGVQETVRAARTAGTAYADQAERIGALAVRDRRSAIESVVAFEAAFEQAKRALAAQTDVLARGAEAAHRRADEAAASARHLLVLAGVCAVGVGAFLVVVIGGSIRRSLTRLRDVAAAVAAGRLDERAVVAGRDEVGQLAESINRMADNLHQMIDRMRAEAERGTFSGELVQALEMVDSEEAVSTAISRAMQVVSAEHPMELLIADSSEAHLERSAVHPARGAPGCGVESPFTCIAVRRGNPVVFPDSEALNACPQLRGRECGRISAVCVPVTFMGRALGVLHAAGTLESPLSTEQADRLTTLGIQAGGRIGTVRAFERTQIQASTDALTGLANRRTLEEAARRLAATATPYAFVLCDLDHFKRLNDTHGHQAGDDALRQFSDVVRSSIRAGDVAARWGGEEFAFLLVGIDAVQASSWSERVRTALAETVAKRGGVAFTASFGIADSTMDGKIGPLTTLADEALYRAKAEGRDRSAIADPAALQRPLQRAASEHRAAVNLRMLAG